MGWHEYYLVNLACLLLPGILLVVWGFRQELSEYGLAPGDRKRGSQLALLGWIAFLPVLWTVGGRPAFQSYYLSNMHASGALIPTNTGDAIDWGGWIFHEATMTVYMLAWEWFFRGFLLFGLRKSFPDWFAVGAQALLFGLLHLGKPPEEVVSSFLGGIVLGFAALRLRSMIPCFAVHALVSASHDAVVIWFHLASPR
ncbi:MAG: lysostaphin resistance A-like protein [Armatimonadota bacterium]